MGLINAPPLADVSVDLLNGQRDQNSQQGAPGFGSPNSALMIVQHWHCLARVLGNSDVLVDLLDALPLKWLRQRELIARSQSSGKTEGRLRCRDPAHQWHLRNSESRPAHPAAAPCATLRLGLRQHRATAPCNVPCNSTWPEV